MRMSDRDELFLFDIVEKSGEIKSKVEEKNKGVLLSQGQW